MRERIVYISTVGMYQKRTRIFHSVSSTIIYMLILIFIVGFIRDFNFESWLRMI